MLCVEHGTVQDLRDLQISGTGFASVPFIFRAGVFEVLPAGS